MRKVVALGATILFAGAVGVAMAQERLPQSSGFGTGVGEGSGVGSRSQIWDKQAFLERLSQPETVMGRVFAIDQAQNRLMLETGGVGTIGNEGQEGKVGYGARTVMTLHLTDRSNLQQIKNLHVGDEVTVQVREEVTEAQPFGTGRKMVLDATVFRGTETMAGFGGLGQRPDPATERGIVTNSFSNSGGVVNSVLPGDIHSGITSTVGEMTGAAPCWNCAPQPGWGDNGQSNRSDYGADSNKPNLIKQ